MASIDKLIPRYLNTDDDERLIKNIEMTDAQNLRISVDVERDALVVKNAYGNVARSSTLENGSMPNGTNVAIGSIADDTTHQIYFAVFNSNSNHIIIRYDFNAKKAYKVYQSSVLQFSQDSFVQMSIVRNSNTDILLYLNDGLTPPKKINATKAEQSSSGSGGYPAAFTSGTDAEKLLYITVAKQPPLAPPVIEFSNNPNFPQNDLFEKNFQFAYQYEYLDGEQSALSPYSELSVSKFQLKDGFINFADRRTFNEIRIYVENNKGDVKNIKTYARRGDKDAAFFLINTTLNNPLGGTVSFLFRDDISYIPLSAEVQDKRFDNVPQVADSQAICSSRLFYGGYTEGYPNLVVDGTTVIPNYNERPSVINLPIDLVDNPDASDNDYEKNQFFSINFSQVDPVATEDYSLFLSFSWDDGFVTLKNGFQNNERDYRFFPGDGSNAITESPKGDPLESVSGMRQNGASQGGYKIGPNVDGPLKFPPTIRFIKQKNTSETEEKSVPINEIRRGVKLVTGGIQVRERIEIQAGATRQQVIDAVTNRITKRYPLIANPQAGNGGFSVCTTGGNSASTAESAAFKGKGYSYILKKSQDLVTHVVTYRVQIDVLTISVDKFVFGTKQADVIEPEAPTAQFDFIEGPNNSKSHSNRIFACPKAENGRGQLVGISTPSSANIGRVARVNPSIVSGGCFLIGKDKMDGTKCFKSGAMHQLGIVYFDDRGRAGGVQKVGAADILHTNNRAQQNGLDGYADVVMRVKHTPPVWAKRYSPVYSGKGSIINKVQYGVGGAYLAFNDQSNQGSFGANQSIYLSLNNLQGKENSYTNQFGAMIEYGFAIGDRVRIVQYNGADLVNSYVFRVVKTINLIDDQLINPLLDRSSRAAVQNTTGTFLVIEDNDEATGFNSKSILDNNTNWDKQCVIEIFRENKAFDTLMYYEIGTNLPITAGVHGTERTATTNISVKITAQTGSSVEAYSAQQIYKGDIIQQASTGIQILVGNVTPSTAQSGFNFKFFGTTTASPAISTTLFTVTNPDSVLLLENGDSYFRLRNILTGVGASNQNMFSNTRIAFAQNNIVEFVEDYRVSDFYSSEFQSLGRSFPFLPDARTYKRIGSLTYSDPFNNENTTLGLSSFNTTKLNYKDLSYDYGSIRSLVPYNESMYVLHERRAGVIPIGRNVISSDTGEALVASNLVIGPPRYYAAEHGINNNPESVASYRGYVFFVDSIAAKVCRIGFESGLEVISEQLVDSFFESVFHSDLTTATNRRYIGGIDRENTEYIISASPLFTSTITIDDSLTGNQSTGFGKTNSASTLLNPTPVYDDSLTLSFDSDPRNFEDDQDEFNTSGSGLLIIDQQTNLPIVAISESLSPAYQNGALTSAVPITVTSSSFNSFVPATFSQNTTNLTLASTAQSTGTITNTIETLPSFCIAYDIRANYWSTRYSYIPEQIVSLSDSLFTIKSGIIYEHTPAVARNTFYGTAAPSIVEVVANFNPSMVKVYEAISLEGNSGAWSCTMNNASQTSSIASTIWQEKEGFYYAPIHQDSTQSPATTSTANITSVDGTSQFFALGVVNSASGSVINFKNAINNMSFPVGTTTALYKVSGAALVPLGYRADSRSGESQITCNATATGVVQNDTVVLVAASSIEGDALRDYFLQVTLSNSLTTAHELYAINLIYAKSNLHNQQGQ